jgi:hypothetical protein
MYDTDFYGDTIYRYDYDEAVLMNYVTQFKIVPIWNKDFASELKEKMTTRNLTHCIHFYETVKGESSKNIRLNDVDLANFKNGQKITDKTKNRDIVLNNFKNQGGHLLSCKTISYGIDIPECDSVFLSYIGKSIPDLVQKIMRSIRLYKQNPNKISYIFLLMDDQEEFEEGECDAIEIQQQLIFKIASMLTEGIDIDILNNYNPYKRIAKLENEIVELNEILEEITLNEVESGCEVVESRGEVVGGELDLVEDYVLNEEQNNIQQAITETENVINTLKEKKSSKANFDDFFEDFELRAWYKNGEIKSQITFNENMWQEKYDKLITFVKENNKIPSQHSKIEEVKSLGKWCSNQRTNYKKNILTETRIKDLETIQGWYWEQFDQQWQEKFETLKEFVKETNTIPSEKSKIKETKTLGIWCSNQRVNYKKNILTETRIKDLQTIQGWYWSRITTRITTRNWYLLLWIKNDKY